LEVEASFDSVLGALLFNGGYLETLLNLLLNILFLSSVERNLECLLLRAD